MRTLTDLTATVPLAPDSRWTEVIGVEQWAEIRRLHFVRGLSIREISRRTVLHRDTIRRAISSDEPPAYSRAAKGLKLDPSKPEIQRLLRGSGAARRSDR